MYFLSKIKGGEIFVGLGFGGEFGALGGDLDDLYSEIESPITANLVLIDIVSILINTIDKLQLFDRDLSWVHPDYEQEFKRSLKSNQNLVA